MECVQNYRATCVRVKEYPTRANPTADSHLGVQQLIMNNLSLPPSHVLFLLPPSLATVPQCKRQEMTESG